MDTQTITVCSICTENLASGASEGDGDDVAVIVTTACGHLFHGKCFQNWTKPTPERLIPSCPNCRKATLGQPVAPIFPSFLEIPLGAPRNVETLDLRRWTDQLDQLENMKRESCIQALEALYAGVNHSHTGEDAMNSKTQNLLKLQFQEMDLIRRVSWMQLDSIPPPGTEPLPKPSCKYLPKCLRPCLGVQRYGNEFKIKFQHVVATKWNLIGQPKPADCTTEEKIKIGTILQNAMSRIAINSEVDGPPGLKELGFRCFNGKFLRAFGYLPYVTDPPLDLPLSLPPEGSRRGPEMHIMMAVFEAKVGMPEDREKPGELRTLAWFNDEAHLTIVGMSRKGGIFSAHISAGLMRCAIEDYLPTGMKFGSKEAREVMLVRFNGEGKSMGKMREQVKGLGVEVRVPFHLPNVLELCADSLKTTDGICGDIEEASYRVVTGRINFRNCEKYPKPSY